MVHTCENQLNAKQSPFFVFRCAFTQTHTHTHETGIHSTTFVVIQNDMKWTKQNQTKREKSFIWIVISSFDSLMLLKNKKNMYEQIATYCWWFSSQWFSFFFKSFFRGKKLFNATNFQGFCFFAHVSSDLFNCLFFLFLSSVLQIVLVNLV